jgi:hypothetical protein
LIVDKRNEFVFAFLPVRIEISGIFERLGSSWRCPIVPNG